MKLIVGLGNPDGYEHTRHNVGWDVVDALARGHRAHWQPTKFPRARYGQWNGGRVRVLVPLTMMNASGAALVSALDEWKTEPAETLIVCDDVNLPLGQLRLRAAGSDGGHHGLASCLAALGTDAVPRLRIGVGREGLPRDLTGFVLSTFDADERPLIASAMARAVEACDLWVERGIEAAMNQVNAKQTP